MFCWIFKAPEVIVKQKKNHTTALQFQDRVDGCIEEKLKFKAMLGQFKQKAISMHASPFLTREK